jgi:hypothetical protein
MEEVERERKEREEKIQVDYSPIFARLAKSKFRSKIHLDEHDKKFVERTIKKGGIEKLRSDVRDLLISRIKIKAENDGRQTPWKGHPAFVAMHALALCCRKCIFKWHKIPEDKPLSDDEIEYFTSLILAWISLEMNA